MGGVLRVKKAYMTASTPLGKQGGNPPGRGTESQFYTDRVWGAEFESQLYHLPAGWPWASLFPSLSFSSLSYTVGFMPPSSRD